MLNALTQYSSLIAVIACVVATSALMLALNVRVRLQKLTLGSGTLEKTLLSLIEHKEDTRAFREDIEKYLRLVENRLRGSIAGVGMVRFNPFENSSGSNQSFAVAFLDEQHNGIVLSSLYARDRMAIYGKPIERGLSTFALTEEEKKAIEQAVAHITTKASK